MKFKDAYDVKELGKDLAEAGIPMAEVTALKVSTIVLDWVKKSAAKSTEGIAGVADDFVAMGVDPAKIALQKVLDLNHDGKIG